MPKYIYKAKDRNGKESKGTLTVQNRAVVTAMLKDRHLTPIDIREQKDTVIDEWILKFKKMLGVPMKDKVVFTRQLASIINAGIPLVEALRLIEDQTANALLKSVITDVLADIESGTEFAEALFKHPDVFSPLFVNIVRAGEVSGTLDTSLTSLAEQMQKDAEIIGKIKGALILPGMVILVIIGVIILMSVAVIPSLAELFNEAGASLPVPTRMMMWLSDFLIHYWWLAIMIAGGVIFAFLKVIKTPQGKKTMDAITLKSPVFGNLTKLVIFARSTKVLALLLTSGVPLLKGMDIVADLAGNEKYTQSLHDVSKKIEIGVPFAQAIREEGDTYPSLIPQMLGIGEQTGGLDNMLGRLAILFDNEVENIVKNLTTLMEPMLMVIMGGAVAFIVMAVLMPIYNLVNVVQ